MSAPHVLPVIFAVHPSQYQSFSTEELRQYFLLDDLKKTNSFNLTYTHYDRLIAGTVLPGAVPLKLPSYENLKSSSFLERRELGVINVGGKGKISVDGQVFELEKYDCLYIGMGSKEILFSAMEAGVAPIFYLLSSPAHAVYPTTFMKADEASLLQMGNSATSNERTIFKYIYMDGIQSCQLVMGLTILKPGSVWNTMPSHIHDRRAEIYFYFDLAEDQRIMHFMGEPHRTRNIVISNMEAVASPSWSIHSGCGTASYSFIWGMAGENKDYTDMDPFPAAQLF